MGWSPVWRTIASIEKGICMPGMQTFGACVALPPAVLRPIVERGVIARATPGAAS